MSAGVGHLCECLCGPHVCKCQCVPVCATCASAAVGHVYASAGVSHMCATCMCVLHEEGTESLGTGITDCKLPNMGNGM